MTWRASFYIRPDSALYDDGAAMLRHKIGQRNLLAPSAPIIERLRFTLEYLMRGGFAPLPQRMKKGKE